MSLDKRIREIEKHFQGGEIVLKMPDGRSHVLRLGRGRDAADLFARCLSNPDCEEARMIAASISANEPGGSRICEMIAAVLD
jgi:hypothetical protein